MIFNPAAVYHGGSSPGELAKHVTDGPVESPVDYRFTLPGSKFREHLQTLEGDGWRHFDDFVFKTSAGGIALSVTFLGVAEVSPSPWMFASWMFWAFSLMAVLVSIWTGQFGLREQISRWDAGTYYRSANPAGGWGRATSPLNMAALIGSMLGLACLLWFAYVNISSGGITVRESTPLREGTMVPQAPPDTSGIVSPQAPAQFVNPSSVPLGPGTYPGAGVVPPQAPPAPTPPTKAGT